MDDKSASQVVINLNPDEVWAVAAPYIEKIWASVFETTDKLLKVHADFGFTQFEVKVNPKLTTVLFALNVLEQILDSMYSSDKLSHEETRLVLNSKQQILLVQRVAEAVRGNCEADYDQAIELMSKQAVF